MDMGKTAMIACPSLISMRAFACLEKGFCRQEIQNILGSVE